MEEVLAIWNSTSSEVKKYIPRVTWETSEPAKEIPICSPTKELVSSSTFDLPCGENIPTFERFVLQGSPFVRLAGLSGAAAVALGAYGAHSFPPEKQEMKRVYDTANFYHFVHTMALFAIPLSSRPALSGSLMIGGMTVFCGTIYYHALTEEKALRKYTPYGGVMLIMAWLTLVL